MSLSFKKREDREKRSPYECGFECLTSARYPFSLRFFLVAAIFVVFDVEVALLTPITYSAFFFVGGIKAFSVAAVFLLLLFLGLYHEHREGSLE